MLYAVFTHKFKVRHALKSTDSSELKCAKLCVVLQPPNTDSVCNMTGKCSCASHTEMSRNRVPRLRHSHLFQQGLPQEKMFGELCVQHFTYEQQFKNSFQFTVYLFIKLSKSVHFPPVQYSSRTFYPNNTELEAQCRLELCCVSQVTDDFCRASVKILPDSVIMNCSSRGNKQMPDGMGKWNDPITLEEDHSHTIN